jgi:hypothetical protein
MDLGFSAVAAAFFGVVLVTSAKADETPLGKRCILASAVKLPTIPGLEVVGSRTKPATKPDYLDVTIDFEAAKQRYTAKFECLSTPNGAVTKLVGQPE